MTLDTAALTAAASAIVAEGRPVWVADPRITRMIALLREHRAELVHYAGASYYDPVAWAMVVAFAAAPGAAQPELKSAALLAAYGWRVTPAQMSY